MENLGLSQKDVQFRYKWKRRIKGQQANPNSPGTMAVKMQCVTALISWTDIAGSPMSSSNHDSKYSLSHNSGSAKNISGHWVVIKEIMKL